MKYFIGADLGTSALKLLLVNEQGEILKTISKSYDVCYPKAGWSEQNPKDWWEAFKTGVNELTKDIDKEDIKGIGAGGQMHGLVILDENDEVIRPAILWNDGRTVDETKYLNTVIGKDKLSEYTANIAFAGFTAPKLLWLYNNERENFDKIKKIMLPKDYINYRLTGVHSTDYSDASGFLLLDVKNKCYSKEMLEICKIKEEQLPKLFESYEKTGTVLKDIADELNLTENCIVCAGAGDNAGAAIGTNTVGEGKCNISLGTSGTIFISSENFSVDKFNSLHSFCHADGNFHLMGCILSAASCNKWFLEDILNTNEYAEEQEKITISDENHVYFLPYLMGERSPLNDTDARGAFIGMRADTKREDMVLAVLEGVAFAMRDNLEVAKSLGIDIKKSTLCGGGAKSKLWQEIVANVLGIDIEIPCAEEGPGYGGAILAMVASGEYENVYECTDRFIKVKEVIKPTKELTVKYEKMYQKFKVIYPALKGVYKTLKEEN